MTNKSRFPYNLIVGSVQNNMKHNLVLSLREKCCVHAANIVIAVVIVAVVAVVIAVVIK